MDLANLANKRLYSSVHVNKKREVFEYNYNVADVHRIFAAREDPPGQTQAQIINKMRAVRERIMINVVKEELAGKVQPHDLRSHSGMLECQTKENLSIVNQLVDTFRGRSYALGMMLNLVGHLPPVALLIDTTRSGSHRVFWGRASANDDWVVQHIDELSFSEVPLADMAKDFQWHDMVFTPP